MDPLTRLQAWYFSRCDGDWEHDSGFSIDALDNPGWIIRQKLSLLEMKLADRFVKTDRTKHDWVHVIVNNDVLRVACGPLNLGDALTTFLDIVEGSESELKG